jgi:hypothetical protein
MTFTIETLYKTIKTGFMRTAQTDEPSAYRVMRDDGMCMGTYQAEDLQYAKDRCDELNDAFKGVTIDQYHADIAEHCGQG